MTPSTALQPPLERPSEDFRKAVHVCYRGGAPAPNASSPQPLNASGESAVVDLPGGVKIYAHRDGAHVIGRVFFPFPVNGRNVVEISYFNAVPIDNRQSTIDNPLDAKALARKAMVLKWRSLCDADKSVTRLDHAKAVCAAAIGFKCSPRSLQLWSRKLDTEGPAGLSDRYDPAPRKVLSLDAALAKDAVSICAWWAFRIGNEPTIDSKMVHFAASLLPRAEFVRNILAAIEVYYAWPTDRLVKYPFKSFARWARWEFEKWRDRAAADNGEMERNRATPQGEVPLQMCGYARRYRTDDGNVFLASPRVVPVPMGPSIPDVKTRRRQTRNFATRRAIASLPGCLVASLPSYEVASPSPVASSSPLPGCLIASLPSQPVASLPGCLVAFPDHYRWLLIRAARGDTDAVNQAVVTMPIWWDKLPEQLRNNIDARAAAWKQGHPTATNYAVAGRKLAMLGPSIRRPQKGPVRACDLLELAV